MTAIPRDVQNPAVSQFRPTASASSIERSRALIVLAMMLLVTIAAWTARTAIVGPSSTFMTALGAALFIVVMFTGVVMAARALRDGEHGLALLAAAYLFSAPLVVGNVLTLSTTSGALFPYQTPPWMWCFWHLGWASLMSLFAWRTSGWPNNTLAVIVLPVSIAFLCAAVSLGFAPFLPVLLTNEGRWQQILIVLYVVIGVLYVAALAGFAKHRDSLTRLELWAAVAVVASTCEIALTATSLARFSVGFYVGRSLAVVSGLAVLVAVALDYVNAARRAAAMDRNVLLAEASPLVVFMTDAAGACTFVNSRWTELTGQSYSDALDHGWLNCFSSKDAEAIRIAFKRDMRSGTPNYAELRFRIRDGTYRWFAFRATPIRDRVHNILGWNGSALDIDDNRRALEDAKAASERERKIAERLQQSFLPAFLPDISGLHFEAVYRPATSLDRVGGDWYDAFTIGRDCVALSVGDVTGHGLDAASTMMRVRETIRAAATALNGEPAAVLAFANRALCADNTQLATAVFAVYNRGTGSLSYSSAGHPPPLARRQDVAVFLPGGGIALGIFPESTFPTNELRLSAGDLIALYTDGLIENTRDALAGERRLLASFGVIGATALSIVDGILASGQNDDVAILTLEVVDKPAAV